MLGSSVRQLVNDKLLVLWKDSDILYLAYMYYTGGIYSLLVYIPCNLLQLTALGGSNGGTAAAVDRITRYDDVCVICVNTAVFRVILPT